MSAANTAWGFVPLKSEVCMELQLEFTVQDMASCRGGNTHARLAVVFFNVPRSYCTERPKQVPRQNSALTLIQSCVETDTCFVCLFVCLLE
jgi:hypothetical protein